MSERLKESAAILGVPRRLGYADAQWTLDKNNFIYDGITTELDGLPEFDPLPKLINGIIASNTREEKIVIPFLEWIKATYNPKLVYYPFSGWHISPREIFGQDRVVHLLNDDNNPYLRDIGSGIRIKGDVLKQPFRDNIFDTIFLNRHDARGKDVGKVFAEFRRVLKEDGLFVVDKNQRNIVNYCRKNLEGVEIPEDIKASIDSSFELFRNRDRERTRRFLWWKR